MKKFETFIFHTLIQLTLFSLSLKADDDETDKETTTTKSPPTIPESMNLYFFSFTSLISIKKINSNRIWLWNNSNTYSVFTCFSWNNTSTML